MPVLGSVGSVSSSSFGGGGATDELFDGPTDFYVVINHGPGTITQLSGSAVFATKDMYASTKTWIPTGANPHTNSSGYSDQLNTGNINGNRYLWSDWSSDVFDGWGSWYIYDENNKTASNIQFNAGINDADGTIFEETTSNSIYHGKDFRIRHGWVDQGIFRLDILCYDVNFVFSVGHWGNMGSDGSNQQFLLKSPGNVLTGSTNRTLFYLSNQQTHSSNEIFSLYCIPKVVDQNVGAWNSTRFFGGIHGTDDLYMYVKSITHGVTFYYAKSLDQQAAISADIGKSSVYTA